MIIEKKKDYVKMNQMAFGLITSKMLDKTLFF